MRINFPEHLEYPELQILENFPIHLNNEPRRDVFEAALLKRSADFKRILELQFRTLCESNHPLNILAAGDWHAGGPSVLLESDAHQFVIKQRDCTIDQYIGTHLAAFCRPLPVSLRVPEISNQSRFWTQEAIQAGSRPSDFFRSIGALAAFSVWWGLFDLHHENLICNNQGIHLIDADCAFLSYRGLTIQGRIKHLGIFNQPSSNHPALLSYEQCDFHSASNDLFSGWSDGILLLKSQPIKFACPMISEMQVRRLLLPTRIYLRFLQQRYIYCWSEREARKRWLHIIKERKTFLGIKINDKIVNCEIVSLMNWTIPHFVQIGDSLYSTENLKLPTHQNLPTLEKLMLRHHRKLKKQQLSSNILKTTFNLHAKS